MSRWAGWGAGPAGAGAVGGPTRVFVGLALVGALVVAGVLLHDGKIPQGLAALACAGYFALRFLGRIGPRRGDGERE